MLVVSHQPLAGAGAVDNAKELQQVLRESADKVLLAVNGHTHIDDIVRVDGVRYWHVNSASYYWVGESYKHVSYRSEIHARYPVIGSTCPYRDPLSALLTLDLETGAVTIDGHEGAWQGKSPGQLSALKGVALTDGEEIVPRIRSRQLL